MEEDRRTPMTEEESFRGGILRRDGSYLLSTLTESGEEIPDRGRAEIKAGEAIYQIMNMLARGGSGITYRALDTRTGQILVIKEIWPVNYGDLLLRGEDRIPYFREEVSGEIKSAVRRETDSLAERELANYDSVRYEVDRTGQLTNAPASFGVFLLPAFPDSPCRYLVMDTVNGLTLRDYLHHAYTGDLTVDLEILLRTMAEVSGKVGVLHRKGLLHADLKPENIYITLEGTAVLLDLASALSLDRETGSAVPKAGLRSGTTGRYASPELRRFIMMAESGGMMTDEGGVMTDLGVMMQPGRPVPLPAVKAMSRITSRSDVYSLTVILSELYGELKEADSGNPDDKEAVPLKVGKKLESFIADGLNQKKRLETPWYGTAEKFGEALFHIQEDLFWDSGSLDVHEAVRGAVRKSVRESRVTAFSSLLSAGLAFAAFFVLERYLECRYYVFGDTVIPTFPLEIIAIFLLAAVFLFPLIASCVPFLAKRGGRWQRLLAALCFLLLLDTFGPGLIGEGLSRHMPAAERLMGLDWQIRGSVWDYRMNLYPEPPGIPIREDPCFTEQSDGSFSFEALHLPLADENGQEVSWAEEFRETGLDVILGFAGYADQIECHAECDGNGFFVVRVPGEMLRRGYGMAVMGNEKTRKEGHSDIYRAFGRRRRTLVRAITDLFRK